MIWRSLPIAARLGQGFAGFVATFGLPGTISDTQHLQLKFTPVAVGSLHYRRLMGLDVNQELQTRANL